MKRIFWIVAFSVLSLTLLSCGGGGGSSSGSLDKPRGEPQGVPSSVQLLPNFAITQASGGQITVSAKVLDGNGVPVGDVPVTFVKVTSNGDLAPTSGVTTNQGIATATVSSTTAGFVTVEASIAVGGSQVRDTQTMLFVEGSPSSLRPTLTLSVEGNGDPFVLFENINDTDVNVTARVLDIGNGPVFGSQVTFGSESSEVSFPLGNTAVTNQLGEASVLVRVTPEVLRDVGTTLSITASADIGAFNVVTLFTEPVTVASVQVSANPASVDSGGQADVFAQALTTAGTGVPDGTTINFTTSSGGIEPFSQTPDQGVEGVAGAQFTAPTLTEGAGNVSATVTASVGGKSGTTRITVIAPPAPPVTPTALAVTPTAAPNTSCSSTVTQSFVVTGGTPKYTVTPSIAIVQPTLTATGFNVTPTATACSFVPVAGSVTVSLVVSDSGTPVQTATATITITNP
jgi:adhesin/invasin